MLESASSRAVPQGLELDNRARTMKLDRCAPTFQPAPQMKPLTLIARLPSSPRALARGAPSAPTARRRS